MAVGGDDRGVARFDQAPGDLLSFLAVPAQEARRVELQGPTARKLAGQLGAFADRLRPLGVGDERREAGALDVLGELDQREDRPGERHLDEHDLRAVENVAGRVVLEQPPRRGQLEAESQLKPRSYFEPLVGPADIPLPLRRQREMRPDVRRGEEDGGAGLGSEVAQLEPVLERRSAVVAGRNYVRVTVHEAFHPSEATRRV